GAATVPGTLASRLRLTLAAPGPWLVAVTFAMYSGQWLAVIGFLPAIYAQAGVAGGATAVLTALAAAANIAGNVGSGRLLQRGVPASRLLTAGFATMALAAVAAFAGGADGGLPGWLKYGAVLCFSGVGGLIPATLFGLALRLAPGPATLSTTVGWVQQWSALGQFAGPPAVAWVASQAGGWQWTWLVTAACSALGLLLTAAIARRLRP
ncbi:MAG TPA: MFS transporter, partial [Rubrivivax sp.]|nr:MFS transporter [Rubrivivax sp.]